MVDRDDDLRIGMKTSAITLGRFDVVAVLAFYGIHLAIWSAVMHNRISLPLYLATIVVALAQVIWHGALIRDRSREGCFKAFRLNHWLGFTLFVAVVLA